MVKRKKRAAGKKPAKAPKRIVLDKELDPYGVMSALFSMNEKQEFVLFFAIVLVSLGAFIMVVFLPASLGPISFNTGTGIKYVDITQLALPIGIVGFLAFLAGMRNLYSIKKILGIDMGLILLMNTNFLLIRSKYRRQYLMIGFSITAGAATALAVSYFAFIFGTEFFDWVFGIIGMLIFFLGFQGMRDLRKMIFQK